MIAALARLCRDRRGFALTEFAFTAPVLGLMYLGSFQLCSAVAAQRKVSTTARAITDLTSQLTITTDAQLDTILNASTQIMSPLDTTQGTFVVTQVNIDPSGNAKVDWSRAKNATPLTRGTTYNVPASIKQNGTSLIVSDVTYQYSAGTSQPILGNITLKDRIYMSPRGVVTIVNTDHPVGSN